MARLLILLGLALAAPASAQDFPQLTGRVVDTADLLPPADEISLTQKLEALQRASSRQLVVATVPELGGYPIEDYGYRLGRHWGIGQSEANNGIILLVAKAERRVRIEVGYGLEPIVTDGLSSRIIRTRIIPAFKQGDFPAGIHAGTDALIAQLQATPEQAEQAALAAQQEEARQQASGGGGGSGGMGSVFPLIFWGIVLVFVILPMLRGGRRGRRYRRRGGVFIWGPGFGSGWGGGGSSWGGGGGGWGGGGGGGGFGGFSGGGGSFGGGGASGGW